MAPYSGSSKPGEGYYPPAYPFMYNPNSTYRKRVKGKDPEYARRYYSHLARVNSPDASVEYKEAHFFVIKSFMEEDVHKAMKYQVWSSTPEGNNRLNNSYLKSIEKKIPVFLFFSVNGSRQFVGVAKMTSEVNFSDKCGHWVQDGKWLGKFKLEWLFIKDIPNREFKHILVPTNENKPITNMRDAQEVPFEQGMIALKIFKDYSYDSYLLDEFEYYDNCEIKHKETKATETFGRVKGDYTKTRGKGKRKDKRFQESSKETEYKKKEDDKKETKNKPA